jgi:hypothetical protein
MLEGNAEIEDYGVEEEGEALSHRMHRLYLNALTVKSFASLPNSPTEQPISAPLLNASRTLLPQPRTSVPVIKQSRRKRSSAALSKTRTKPPSHSPHRKDSYCLEDGKMFELAEGGRAAMVKEVKNMMVREFSGREMLMFPNGKKFEGEWVEGLLIGKAKITHANGDTYIGDTYQFQRHGRGALHYASGYKY